MIHDKKNIFYYTLVTPLGMESSLDVKFNIMYRRLASSKEYINLLPSCISKAMHNISPELEKHIDEVYNKPNILLAINESCREVFDDEYIQDEFRTLFKNITIAKVSLLDNNKLSLDASIESSYWNQEMFRRSITNFLASRDIKIGKDGIFIYVTLLDIIKYNAAMGRYVLTNKDIYDIDRMHSINDIFTMVDDIIDITHDDVQESWKGLRNNIIDEMILFGWVGDDDDDEYYDDDDDDPLGFFD